MKDSNIIVLLKQKEPLTHSIILDAVEILKKREYDVLEINTEDNSVKISMLGHGFTTLSVELSNYEVEETTYFEDEYGELNEQEVINKYGVLSLLARFDSVPFEELIELRNDILNNINIK